MRYHQRMQCLQRNDYIHNSILLYGIEYVMITYIILSYGIAHEMIAFIELCM